MNKAVERVVEETLRIYPKASQVWVTFYHDENGNDPYPDRYEITLKNGDKVVDYLIADEVEEELDVIRTSGHGYSFRIDIDKKAVL